MRKRIRASSLPPSPNDEAKWELGELTLLELGSMPQPKSPLSHRRRALVSRELDPSNPIATAQLQNFLISAIQPINSSVMSISEGQQQMREDTSRIVAEVKWS